MRIGRKKAVGALLVALVAVWGLAMVFSWFSRRPDGLGVHGGRLTACPASPNCVCSQDAGPAHAIEPLRFDDNADAAWDRLRRTVRAQPRMRVITEDDGYLHAEATTRLLRFVDDVEFLLDRVGRQIHVRSASRLGYSDLGTNRRRIEAIRAAFAETK